MALDWKKLAGGITSGILGDKKENDQIVGKEIKSPFVVFLIIFNIIMSFVTCGTRVSFGEYFLISFIAQAIVFVITAIVLFKNGFLTKSKNNIANWIFLIGLAIVIVLCAFGNFNIDDLLGSFFFSLAILLFFMVLIKVLQILFGSGTDTTKTYYIDAEGNYAGDKEGPGLSPKTVTLGYHYMIFSVVRTLALSTLLMTSLWVLVASPFSLFGGSSYGFFMQLIITVPLMLLLSSFWSSGNNWGLLMITGASFAAYMLSFMFPTLFANLWVLSTTSSASAGASAVSSFGEISPLSYYKSTYVVRTGQTEKRMGPTYELISDEVIGSTFRVEGRLCDESDIVAVLTMQNLAKFELKDLSVQFSALRNPYCARDEEGNSGYCNVCQLTFKVGDKVSTYSELVSNLPKGVPREVRTTFRTTLFADVMEQACMIRSNILANYHTTSVFPMSFIDYDTYLLNPINIGNPVSTSSFGRVLLSMDVGQQPIVVNEERKDSDQILLKLAWSQKEEGLVNDPKLVLYLPEDLGQCEVISETSGYTGSLGVEYTGLYGYNRDRTGLLSQTDFDCYRFNGASRVMTDAELNIIRINLGSSLQIFFENLDVFYEESKGWTLSEYIGYYPSGTEADLSELKQTMSRINLKIKEHLLINELTTLEEWKDLTARVILILDSLITNTSIETTADAINIILDEFDSIKDLIPSEQNTLLSEYEIINSLKDSSSSGGQISSINDFCETIFSGTSKAEAEQSAIYYTPEYSSSFSGMPSVYDACNDLVSRGYTVCLANKPVGTIGFLTCAIDLKGLDVSNIDLSTYLVRADAIYSFNTIREETFTVTNCNAI